MKLGNIPIENDTPRKNSKEKDYKQVLKKTQRSVANSSDFEVWWLESESALSSWLTHDSMEAFLAFFPSSFKS